MQTNRQTDEQTEQKYHDQTAQEHNAAQSTRHYSIWDNRQYSVSQKPLIVDVNSRSGSLTTPLMLAAEAGHAATVSLLLQRGAKVNLRNIHGNTALISALGNRRNNVITILRNNGGV